MTGTPSPVKARYTLAVNGQPAVIEAPPDTPISEVLAEAIRQTENERWGGVGAWECRTPLGELVDDSTCLGALVTNERGVCAFVQLKPGWGA